MDAVGEFRLGEEGGQGGKERLQERGPAGVRGRGKTDPAPSLEGSPGEHCWQLHPYNVSPRPSTPAYAGASASCEGK